MQPICFLTANADGKDLCIGCLRWKENWKSLELEFQHEEPYDIEKLSSYVTTMSVLEPGSQCIRIDSKKEMPFEECLLPISKYSLFNAIKKGDI